MPRNEEPELAPLRATAHPLRLRMMTLLTERAMSAAEVARRLGITHANASYHLRRLLDAGQITVAEEVAVRGGRARRYRHDPSGGLSPGTGRSWTAPKRPAAWAVVAEQLLRRSAYAADPPDGQASADAELWIGAEQWRALCDRAAQIVHDLRLAAVPAGTSGAVRTNTTLAMFTMAEA